MKTTTSALRRCLGSVFAASAVGGVVVAALTIPGTPSADAAADPCAASSIAHTIGSVAVSSANYLDAHPETDNTLTAISQQQTGPQSLTELKAYFDANPQVAKDMQTLQQPLMNLSARCKLPLTLPQAMGLLQGAQSQGAALPAGALSAAQQVGAPATALPVQSAPATGTGPLPGPTSR
ncbi:hemophore [Mycolicibacterium madagascariense]|uniref:Hemophore n=1 Tax=Mycolicibacterium madagascariense TaxID=212765 RepID=A0A7I7X9E4_9MYCO|nr:hemophore [Mycolicibacterium madagascariense]MCV7012935.1 hemophore [Mycolicibacterium madagascariense]BBZ26184.1 hemophore [Mycolicibacterium madagascariense]